MSRVGFLNVYQRFLTVSNGFFRNLFFDAALMTGTPEAIYFLKQKFESNEMNKAQVSNGFNGFNGFLTVLTVF